MHNEYRIIEDPKYNYLRVEPIPTQEQVDKFYLEDFYSSNYSYFNDSSLEVQEEEKEFFQSRFEDIYSTCLKITNGEKINSLFDIGFGFAQALLFFKEKGLNVSGIEPAKEGFEYAKKKGLEVYNSNIEDFSCVGNKRFNVVTMLNVLEHLRDPAKIILNVKEQLISKDGLLVIDVPNEFNDFQIIANQEYNLNEWWVCPPNHINYFSASSLDNLLKACGFNVVYKESSFPLEIFMLMEDVYVGNSELGKQCHNKRVSFEKMMKKYNKTDKLRRLYSCLADLNLGRQVIAYATPQN